jgi:predicted ribosome quality control (RQC) complex YloA/Tae2 family protein
MPPSLTDAVPSLSESQNRWQSRISLVPGQLHRNLLKNYRGLSKALIFSMIRSASLDPEQSTDSLNPDQWQQLFHRWLYWLQCLENSKFHPSFTPEGYTVIDWPTPENLGAVSCPPSDSSISSVQELLNSYYTGQINQEVFAQLRHQLTQKLNNVLAKLRLKANTFKERLQQSADADTHKSQADLLMANLQHWEPGMKSISLPDFETEKPVIIPLNPEKNAVQNAQAIYKKHQKLKRARIAVEPLLAAVQEEIDYLEQVEVALSVLETYRNTQDLQTLAEIREELIQQKYLDVPDYRSTDKNAAIEFHRYQTPSGFELLIGRNNRQNDQLTFRTANDYDLWFHTLEIPGSHALLRLKPGTVAEETDLQFAADMTAYYSRARHSEQVPVVYTEPKYVYKPKGAKPGMVVYKQERIVWGRPQQAPA